MTKNQILSDEAHRKRQVTLTPLARSLSYQFTWDQLWELNQDLQRWVNWGTGDEDPVFDDEAPDGAELLTAVLNQALTYAKRPVQDVALP